MSSFVAEFVKRKLAEKNRKPGGKKKKGAAAAAAAAAAVPQSSGVSAAAVGLVSAGARDVVFFARRVCRAEGGGSIASRYGCHASIALAVGMSQGELLQAGIAYGLVV